MYALPWKKSCGRLWPFHDVPSRKTLNQNVVNCCSISVSVISCDSILAYFLSLGVLSHGTLKTTFSFHLFT